MIVLGADTHKRSHTIAAVVAATGELIGEQTVQVGGRGFDALLRWGRGLDDELVWALEDCRHVSGSLERFLIERGERVLRIPTQLTARERKARSPTGQVRRDRRAPRRPRRSAGRPGLVPRRASRRARTRPAAAGRSSRTPRPPPG